MAPAGSFSFEVEQSRRGSSSWRERFNTACLTPEAQFQQNQRTNRSERPSAQVWFGTKEEKSVRVLLRRASPTHRGKGLHHEVTAEGDFLSNQYMTLYLTSLLHQAGGASEETKTAGLQVKV